MTPIRTRMTLQFVFILFFLVYTKIAYSAPRITPNPPELTAKSYLLLDYHSGHVLAQNNINEKLDPASLTKMMTMYVIDNELNNGKLKKTDTVRISKKAWRMGGSKMFVEVGKEVPVEDLIRGIIIQSGNDACVAMAEHIAGSEEAFADLMNHYAKHLGMHDTHFVNATGMPNKNHYTTAKDLGTLSIALIRDFPDSYKLYSEKEFKYNKISQTNRNRLLWVNDHVDGIKTGHTDSAGYCLIASGIKENTRLISVVLGATTSQKRTNDSNALLTWGFRFFETVKLYPAKESIKKIRIWMGKENELSLGLEQPVFVTIPQGEAKNIKATLEIPKVVKAPAKTGDQVGKLIVTLDNKEIMTQPIIALNTIQKSGIFGRMYDWVALKLTTTFKSKLPTDLKTQ